ncbi:NETI motif-containing protein [Bacillus sp. FJAT-50079]|uniref:NETI motif-containing protein n=1 Tax=Bacillus sp. FJAT-50079 TaxID=2833577 RepID=UPI001BC932EC|nr:NETI motif-containing protein [Bacillus sp. FJAT-50079]MBS4209591.1 NETI motif-containing protein [Bacillus sp. FJAT-50079]
MKKQFEVQEGETIQQCLERMSREGYRPVRRMEKPIFKEEKKKGETNYIPIAQKIVFQGVKEP